MTTKQEAKPLSLLEKLNLIRAEIKVEKEGTRYKAFTVSLLNAALNPLLEKYKIGVVFDVKESKLEMAAKGWVMSGHIAYTLFNLETEEKIVINTPFIGFNQEGDPAKSQGCAHSYSYKYLWVTLLGLTDEESDIDSKHNQQKAVAQVKDSNYFYYDLSDTEIDSALAKYLHEATAAKVAEVYNTLVIAKRELKKLARFKCSKEQADKIMEQDLGDIK